MRSQRYAITEPWRRIRCQWQFSSPADNREDVLVIDDLSAGFRLAVQSVKTTALYEQYLLLVSDRLAIEGSEVDARRSCLTEASTLFANAVSARLNLG